MDVEKRIHASIGARRKCNPGGGIGRSTAPVDLKSVKPFAIFLQTHVPALKKQVTDGVRTVVVAKATS